MRFDNHCRDLGLQLLNCKPQIDEGMIGNPHISFNRGTVWWPLVSL